MFIYKNNIHIHSIWLKKFFVVIRPSSCLFIFKGKSQNNTCLLVAVGYTRSFLGDGLKKLFVFRCHPKKFFKNMKKKKIPDRFRDLGHAGLFHLYFMYILYLFICFSSFPHSQYLILAPDVINHIIILSFKIGHYDYCSLLIPWMVTDS